MKRLVLLIAVLSLVVISGCMTTRTGNNADNGYPSGDSFNKKTVAILPVKSQTSITTDSHTPLKKALNKRIQEAVKLKMANAVVIDAQKSLDVLNDAGKLDLVEKILTGYENSGAFDKKMIISLCSALKANYLLVSKLKVEQLDYGVLGKSFSGSLDVILLDKNTSEPLWNGIGDFKRMGVYGAGGTEIDEAAIELVTLAFGQQISNSQQDNQTDTIKKPMAAEPKKMPEESQSEPTVQPASLPAAQPIIQPVNKIPEATVISQSSSSPSATMLTNNNSTKVRKSPSSKAAVVKTLKKGEEVQIVKQKDEWFLVELSGGETGWCHNSVLSQKN